MLEKLMHGKIKITSISCICVNGNNVKGISLHVNILEPFSETNPQ